MSKSKKPRKAYRPTYAPNPRAFMVAIRGAHLLCAHDQLTRAARVRSSVEMLRDLAATWAEVLAIVTCREYFAAEERVKRKVAQALAKGSHGSVRVVEAA